MFIRHCPVWPAATVERGAQGICTHNHPDGSQCNIDLLAGNGGGANAFHFWENTHLLIPSKGERYLVTYREYTVTWPHCPPSQSLGTFTHDGMSLNRDVIFLSVNNRLFPIPKNDILAITDEVPDFFDFMNREAQLPRCLAKIELEEQILAARCKLGQFGHGDTHCATSAIGKLVWWRGTFEGMRPEPAPPRQRRSVWARILGR